MPERASLRKLESLADFERLLAVQRAVWRLDDAALTPLSQFRISAEMGGILLGVFIGGKLAGFVYSFPAEFAGKRSQHSHQLAVLPEFRGQGLGKALKWAQREEALKRGYDLITWTFDPLQARNAALNLRCLGAFSRTYFRNFYGSAPALSLGPGIPTDRLLVEWPLQERRVENRAGGRKTGDDERTKNAPVVLKRSDRGTGNLIRPSRPRLDFIAKVLLAEVPERISDFKKSPGDIADWQTGLRRILEHYFLRGYRAEHFLIGERCFYVLKKGGGRQSGRRES